MAAPETYGARYLRQHASATERRVWYRLKGRQLGVKFRHQHPIGPYVADFACLSARVIVEVDGPDHGDAYDISRQQWLEGRGWKVYRYSVGDVDEDLDGVIAAIWAHVEEDVPTRSAASRPTDLPAERGGNTAKA